MKHLIFYIFTLFFVLIGCNNSNSEVPKVSYDAKEKNKKQKAQEDTTKIDIADLPIHFQGTDVLIFPLGKVQLSKNYKLSTSESYENAGSTNFKISNNIDNEITGFMTNIKFQKLGQDSLTALSKDKLFIQSATYLKEIAPRSKLQLLVYVLEDADTIKDGAVDQDDINTLYISDIQGKNLTKLSANLEELIDWNLVPSANRLYFRTIEDTNKNGKFDKGDAVHYQYVNVLDKTLKVVRYVI